MDSVLQIIKQLTTALNWQTVVIITILIFRQKIIVFIQALSRKLDRPGEFSIGKDGFSFREYVDKKLEEKQNETISLLADPGTGKQEVINLENAELQIKRSSGKSKMSFGDEIETKAFRETIKVSDPDPLRISWEGKPADKNRKVSAIIIPVTGSRYYKIHLKVESTSTLDPLCGWVRFHLHPSFREPVRTVSVQKGIAELTLISYGSFTLGVETDNNTRKLKLDLGTDVEGVSEEFKNT